MTLELRKSLTVEELLESHEIRLLRHPESGLDDVKFTDENRQKVAQLVVDFLDSTGNVLDEVSHRKEILLVIKTFTPSASRPGCDDLDGFIFFYTEADAQRIPYKFVLPEEDLQVTEEV